MSVQRLSWMKKGRLRYLVIGLLLIILAMGWLGWFVGRVFNHSQAFLHESLQAVALLETLLPPQPLGSEGIKGLWEELQEQTTASTLAEAQQHLLVARQELDALRPLVNPVVSRAHSLSNLPVVGPSIQDTIVLWNFANATNHLGEELLEISNLGATSLKRASIEEQLATLSNMSPHLERAQTHFEQAQLARSQVGELSWLPAPWDSQSQAFLTRWDNAVSLLEQTQLMAEGLLTALPALLAQERSKTYLILIQTHDELRATGGFITGVGTIQIEKGEITALTVGKVTDAEPPGEWRPKEEVSGSWVQPPAPLSRYMGLGNWALRDVSFLADFPTTAQLAARFWKKEKGSEVDGVIAINEQGLEALLEGLGPVQLASGEWIDAKNLKEKTLAHVYQGDRSEWFKRQGEFSKELARALLDVVEQAWADRYPNLVEPLMEAFRRRDILFSSFDPNVAPWLTQLGLDGALQTPPGDYLYLVEQNVSYNKLSQFIQQQLEYTVELERNAHPVESTLVIDEANLYRAEAGWSGYPEGYYVGGRWNTTTRRLDMWEGFYGGYTSLYLPLDSQLLEATGFDDQPVTSREGKHTVVGGYVALWTEEEQRLEYRWQHRWQHGESGLPDGQYRLFVQHQPGAPHHELTVNVRLPAGYRAVDIVPSATKVDLERVTWEVVLDQDQSLALRLEQDTSIQNTALTPPPPRLRSPEASQYGERGEQEDSYNNQVAIESSTITSTTVLSAPQPRRLIIPAIAVEAPITAVGLEPSGIMASPDEAQIVGWYELGPRPGDRSNAVLAGHLDWKGEIGAFNRLDELKAGDILDVQSEDGTRYRYLVEQIQTYETASAPVAEIFGPTAGPELTLITCAGSYNPVQQLYRDRLVIRARAAWIDAEQ